MDFTGGPRPATGVCTLLRCAGIRVRTLLPAPAIGAVERKRSNWNRFGQVRRSEVMKPLRFAAGVACCRCVQYTRNRTICIVKSAPELSVWTRIAERLEAISAAIFGGVDPQRGGSQITGPAVSSRATLDAQGE